MAADEHADADAFERFMRAEFGATVRHVAPLVGTLAEDVAQDAFIVTFRNWRHVRELDAPHAWVRLVARRIAYRQGGREAARTQLEREAGTVDSAPAAIDARIDLRRAIRELPVNQRNAVRLHYWADMPVTAIAAALGASESAVKVWMFRARAALGESLVRHTGTWVTAEPWTVEDVERALHALHLTAFSAVVLDELPIGDGRWALHIGRSQYRIETDAGLELDHGSVRITGSGPVLTPWNKSGTVVLGSEIDGDHARFSVGRDTTAPTRGVPDEVYLRMILEMRAFERRDLRQRAL